MLELTEQIRLGKFSVIVSYKIQIFKKIKMKVAVLLFENFETLDVFGPVEIFGIIPQHYQVSFYSLTGGVVKNSHGVSIVTENLKSIENAVDIF